MSVATPELPVVSPGHHLAPAAIGRRHETPQIVYVECPNYCVEDHVTARHVAVEDIVHTSATDHLSVGSFLSVGSVFEMYATIKAEASTNDPRLHRAHVVLDDGSNDAFLTESMAEDVADRLIVFATRIRQLAQAARAANQIAA